MNRLISCILIILLWVGWNPNASAEQNGLLIIHVDLMRLNNKGGETALVDPITKYSIRNLKSGRIYSFSVSRSRVNVDAQEVEEGVYCLYSASLLNIDVPYCNEPFFKVVAGRVNNAGWWRIGYSIEGGGVKLVFGPKYFDEVLAEAKKYEKELLRRYGLEVEN